MGNAQSASVRKSLSKLRRLHSGDPSVYKHLEILSQVHSELLANHKDDLHKFADALIEEKIVETFVRFWDECHENSPSLYDEPNSIMFRNLYKWKTLLWNTIDTCPGLASEFYSDASGIDRIMREFSMPQLDVSKLGDQGTLYWLMRMNLSILHHAVRHDNRNKCHIRKNKGIDKIYAYRESAVVTFRTLVFIVLAYCIDAGKAEENSKIKVGNGVIPHLLQMLKQSVDSPNHEPSKFRVDEALAALTRLAYNEANEKAIVEAGVLPIFEKLLNDDYSSDHEILECFRCLRLLSYDKDNKMKILEAYGLLASVNILQEESISVELKNAIDNFLTQLHWDRKTKAYLQNLRQLHAGDASVCQQLEVILQIYRKLKDEEYEVEETEVDIFAEILIEENVLETFVRFWDECHENSAALYNETESIIFKNLYKVGNFLDRFRKLLSQRRIKTLLFEGG